MTTNQINFLKSKEEKRHNKLMEQETYRANRAKERLSEAELRERARATDIQAEHNRNVLQETGRHNVATESISQAYNVGMLNESIRHNSANELLSSRQIAIDRAYKEGSIANQAFANAIARERAAHDYSIAQMQQAEINRHNMAVESVQEKEYAESVRHNTQGQLLQHLNISEQERHNKAVEDESHRHNVTQERQNQYVHNLNVMDTASEEIRRWGNALGILKTSGR